MIITIKAQLTQSFEIQVISKKYMQILTSVACLLFSVATLMLLVYPVYDFINSKKSLIHENI